MIRETWLTEIAPDAPCGPDLEYDQDFLALERAALGKEEQQFGDKVYAAQEPVWTEVVDRAGALLDRTRDIRVIHRLACGLTRTEGLAGFAAALGLVRDLLDRYWDAVHPRVVVDGEADPLMRINALSAFADRERTLGGLRTADLLRTPAIGFTLRDVEAILDPSVGKTEAGLGLDQLRAAIADAIAADAAALPEAEAIVAAVEAIRATLLTHLEPSMLPDLEPLNALVAPAAKLVAEIRGVAQGVPAAGDGAGAAGFGGGELRSRDDALRALDRVCDFLARSEPTNPAPLLIRRAQRVMTMPFMDIIRELAPDATGQVAMITGVREDA